MNAGLAFNGYDESGKPKWDLIDNVNIIKLEVSALNSLKLCQTPNPRDIRCV